MAVPIVVCACGTRLRAPGARPGRVGRCPGCGASLRIPDEPPPAVADRRSRRPAPAKTRAETLVGSHGFPFRNANGLAYLTVMPAVWWAASLGPLLLGASITVGDQLSELARIAFIPSLLGLPPVLAYALTYLSRTFTETLAGEDAPPRWPDLDVWEQIRALSRWIFAALAGAAVGGVPAWLFWTHTEAPAHLDRGIVGLFVIFGAIYAQTALAAGLAFEDPLAMNPWTVLKAIRKLGFPLLRPLAVAGAALGLGFVVLRPALHSTSPWIALFGLALFWVFITYETLVATRSLGVECRRRAAALGWFRKGSFPR